MSAMKKKILFSLLALAAAGTALLLLSQRSDRTPGDSVGASGPGPTVEAPGPQAAAVEAPGPQVAGDPLAKLGTAWDPEQVRRIAERGRSLFDIGGHESTTIRLDEASRLDHLRQGEPAAAGARTLDISRGQVSFPADCTPWQEPGPCLLWQLPGLSLRKDPDFGGIEVGIRNRRSGEHKFHISFLRRTATVPLVPEKTMKYVILPDISAADFRAARLHPETLALVFPAIEAEDEIAVLSVRVLSKVAGYAGTAAGDAYESLSDEIRPVFYQWTGGEAGWNVEIPEVLPVLKFGIGLLPESSPVTFSIRLESGGGRQEIFTETVAEGNAWSDRRIDLASWKGKRGRLLLATDSSSPEVALWSSPRIVRSGRRGSLVVIYLIDALRPDFCEGFGTFRGIENATPAIRSLGEGGVRFTMTLANGPSTQYSMPALFSGLHPRHTGIVDYHRVPDDIRTLAEVFRQNGFVTASFLLNGNSGRLRGLHQGFDHLLSRVKVMKEARRLAQRGSGVDPVDAVAGNASALINEVLFDFLRTHREEDVFLFLHLMDPHSVYLPGKEFMDGFYRYASASGLEVPADRAALLESLQGWYDRPADERLPDEVLLELYRGTVETSDKHLGRFVEFLESERLLERSTIVLTADHGEHLNEHPESGVFVHGHPNLLEVLRVPLIIHGPGAPAGGVVSQPTQLADVMPTLLDLAGITHDPESFDGTSLLLLMAGQEDPYFDQRPIISQTDRWSVLAGGVHSPDLTRAGEVQIFDVERDPREHLPLRGEEAQRRLDELAGSLALAPQRSVPEVETIVNEEEVLRQLKALGYIQ